jgi:hypothetical protein
MDPAADVGTAVMGARIRRRLVAVGAILFGLLLRPDGAAAADRFALIVTGASGGEEYAQKYVTWRNAFTRLLRERLAYPSDKILVLSEKEEPGVRQATREQIRSALAELRRRATKDDVVLILLIGHGTTGDGAKFNLVGPDMTLEEWAELVRPIPGRVIFVNSASGSFPFLEALAAPNRIVITATESAVQTFETVFPDFFVKAFSEPIADFDKNGKISVWEAFRFASASVRRWFDQRGSLATEQALLDDTGRGVGRQAQAQGPDGAVAQVTYLQGDAVTIKAEDSQLAAMLMRRGQIEADIELLKARKPNMPADEYTAELEKLLLELAQLAKQIKDKS